VPYTFWRPSVVNYLTIFISNPAIKHVGTKFVMLTLRHLPQHLQVNMESNDKTQTAPPKAKFEVLRQENDHLQNKLQQQLEEAKQKDLELHKLKAALVQKDGQLNVYKYQTPDYSRPEEKVFLTKPIFYSLIAVLVCLAALASYAFLFKKEEKRLTGIITYADSSKETALDPTDSILMDLGPTTLAKVSPRKIENAPTENATKKTPVLITNISAEGRRLKKQRLTNKNAASGDERIVVNASSENTIKLPESPQTELTKPNAEVAKVEELKAKPAPDKDEDPNYVELPPQGKYYINVQRAYLYDQPDLKTKGYFYMVPSNNITLFSMDEKNGFVLVEFTSSQGINLRGWVKVSDLVKIN